MRKERRQSSLESEFSLLKSNEIYFLEGYNQLYYFLGMTRIDLVHELRFYFETLDHGPRSPLTDGTGLEIGEEKMLRLLNSNKIRKPSEIELAKALLEQT
jgi:hypothetical protein